MSCNSEAEFAVLVQEKHSLQKMFLTLRQYYCFWAGARAKKTKNNNNAFSASLRPPSPPCIYLCLSLSLRLCLLLALSHFVSLFVSPFPSASHSTPLLILGVCKKKQKKHQTTTKIKRFPAFDSELTSLIIAVSDATPRNQTAALIMSDFLPPSFISLLP